MKYRLFLLLLLALLSLRVSARDDGFRFFSDADRAAIRASGGDAVGPGESSTRWPESSNGAGSIRWRFPCSKGAICTTISVPATT